MNIETILKLADAGIDIHDVQYKFDTPTLKQFGIDVESIIAFTIKGQMSAEVDIKQLIEYITILAKAQRSDNPAVRDLLEKIKTITELTE